MVLILYIVGQVVEVDVPDGTNLASLQKELETRCLGNGSIFTFNNFHFVSLHIDGWHVKDGEGNKVKMPKPE